jgi:hypothetical protein
MFVSVYKSLTLDYILSHLNLIFTTYFPVIHFNIVLPYMVMFRNWSFPLKFYNQTVNILKNFVFIKGRKFLEHLS